LGQAINVRIRQGKTTLLVAIAPQFDGELAVDDALLVGVLHRLADGKEQCQPLGDAQAGVVAIPGEGDALDTP
jgi:hypothetical protein